MSGMSTENKIEVPKFLTPAQVKSFVDDGYLVLDRLISLQEVEEIKADMVKLARGDYPCETLKPLPPEMSPEEVLQNVLCVHQPHFVSPVMEKFARHARICGALSQITAAHLPYWDGSVKCMQTMLFVKPPQFQGQAWHQDEIYIPTRDRSLIGAWIAIDDATKENGCLYVIPGSHRLGYLYPQRAHDQADEWDFAPESHGFDESKKVAVEVKAGSVVFFNGYLLHCSYKNCSNIYRRALVSHYMNAWSLLPWHVQEGKSMATTDVRNVMQVAGIDPYSWKGLEKPMGNVWLRTCKANEKKVDPKADHRGSKAKKEEPALAGK